MKPLLTLIALFITALAMYYASMRDVYDYDKMRNDRARVATGNIEVAVVWPKSIYYDGYRHGAKIAVEQINAAGGVGCNLPGVSLQEAQVNQIDCKRRKISLHFFDENKPNHNDAVSVANKITDNPDILSVIGYLHSLNAISSSVVYEKNGIVMLSSGATSVNLTRHGFDYIFSNAFDDKVNARSLIDHISHQGFLRSYIIYEDGLYGTDFSNYIKQFAVKSDLIVSGSAAYNAWDTNYMSTLSKLIERPSTIDHAFELARLKAEAEQLRIAKEINYILLEGSTNDAISLLLKLEFKTSYSRKMHSNYQAKLENYNRVEMSNLLVKTRDNYKSSKQLNLLTKEFKEQLEIYSQIQITHELNHDLDKYKQYILLLQDELKEAKQRKIGKEKLFSKMLGSNNTNLQAVNGDERSQNKQNNVEEKMSLADTLIIELKEQKNKFEAIINRLTRIKTDNYNIIILAGRMPALGDIILQAREMNIKAPFIGNQSLHGLVNTFKENCQENYTCPNYGEVSVFVPHDVNEYQKEHRAYQDFALEYVEKFGIKPDLWSLQGYDAVQMLAYAFNESKNIEPFIVANTLRYMNTEKVSKDNRTFYRDNSSNKIEILTLKDLDFVSVKENQ